jgi:hypothetical protein
MEFFASLVGIVFGCTISAVIGALFVQFGTNKILGFTPSYPKAWIISFFHQIVGLAINFHQIVGLAINVAVSTTQLEGIGIPLLIGVIISTFFAQSGITYAMINYENKTFKNALKIMGVIWGLVVLIILMLGIPLGLLFYFGVGN